MSSLAKLTSTAGSFLVLPEDDTQSPMLQLLHQRELSSLPTRCTESALQALAIQKTQSLDRIEHMYFSRDISVGHSAEQDDGMILHSGQLESQHGLQNASRVPHTVCAGKETLHVTHSKDAQEVENHS